MRYLDDEQGKFRLYKLKVYCAKCKKLRYSTPLYRTTPGERAKIIKNYVCSDCEVHK